MEQWKCLSYKQEDKGKKEKESNGIFWEDK